MDDHPLPLQPVFGYEVVIGHARVEHIGLCPCRDSYQVPADGSVAFDLLPDAGGWSHHHIHPLEDLSEVDPHESVHRLRREFDRRVVLGGIVHHGVECHDGGDPEGMSADQSADGHRCNPMDVDDVGVNLLQYLDLVGWEDRDVVAVVRFEFDSLEVVHPFLALFLLGFGRDDEDLVSKFLQGFLDRAYRSHDPIPGGEVTVRHHRYPHVNAVAS